MRLVTLAGILILVAAIPVVITGTGQESVAGSTGLEALNTFTKEAKLADGEAVLGLVGFYGEPLPPQWLILTADPATPGVLRESVFARGKVLAERRFRIRVGQDLPDLPIARKSVKIDSNEAFTIAEKVAKKKKVSFDSSHFQLRVREDGKEPVWMLSLLGRSHVAIGTIYISAKSGTVLREVWLPAADKQSTAISAR